ncbi:response regulator [Flavobacteriaceae bacterium S356]|uniref:Response regulator n=1 Tax=Asprobacillus argus TaxID=3076534 RepID=A0ABU3LFI3_9FLAO|nr:response regulator [Flavobacteriaceae bacterium S356]
MFRKVLIVDDHAMINDGVSSNLSKIGITDVHTALYCDDAYLKIKRAALDHIPFDLVITDLEFKKDHRECAIASGEALVKKLKTDYPNLSIIVYSQEDHFQKVRSLMNDCSADGYVWKGREGNKELLKALKIVFEGATFLSQKVARALQQKEDHEITDYDIALVKLLSSGMSQTQISHHFKSQSISPSSVSSVEKRLNRLKDEFLANNATHLVSIFKDQKLI